MQEWYIHIDIFSKLKVFSRTHGLSAGSFTSGPKASEASTLASSHSSPPSSSVTGWPLSRTLRTWFTTPSPPTTELILNHQYDWQTWSKLRPERLINKHCWGFHSYYELYYYALRILLFLKIILLNMSVLIDVIETLIIR